MRAIKQDLPGPKFAKPSCPLSDQSCRNLFLLIFLRARERWELRLSVETAKTAFLSKKIPKHIKQLEKTSKICKPELKNGLQPPQTQLLRLDVAKAWKGLAELDSDHPRIIWADPPYGDTRAWCEFSSSSYRRSPPPGPFSSGKCPARTSKTSKT